MGDVKRQYIDIGKDGEIVAHGEYSREKFRSIRYDFVKFNRSVSGGIFDTVYHDGIFLRVVPFLEFNTNRILLGKNYHLHATDLSRVLGIGYKSSLRFLKVGFELGIFKRYKGSVYVNPVYSMRGKKIKEEIWRLFNGQKNNSPSRIDRAV